MLKHLTLKILKNNLYNSVKALFGPTVRSATANEFPYVVSIMRLRTSSLGLALSSHKCTGTLITRQDVLTADHCLLEALTAAIKVVIGSIDLTQGRDYFPLFCLSYNHWATHRQMETDLIYNDIAFIKLLQNVPETLQLAFTGNAPSSSLYGLDVVIAGWGRLENDTSPNILQTVAVNIISHAHCEEVTSMYAGERIFINDRHLCTIGNPYALLNKGDSGGPLLYFGSLIGVNSGVCPIMGGFVRPEQVNIHTSLRYYHDFIIDVPSRFYMNY